jgi:ABC-type lipoprotein export system ATPase subunit
MITHSPEVAGRAKRVIALRDGEIVGETYQQGGAD